MEREFARSLLPLVNDKEGSVLLLGYIEHRVQKLKDALCIAKSFDEVCQLQGSIRELNRFETLKSEVLQFAKG